MRDANQEPTEELVLLGQTGIPELDIMQQVETLCHSSSFDGRERARELLRFLVNEALAGKVPRPAEIARHFGKKDFTPGDSYVRSIAGDLRKYLQEHYDSRAKPGEVRFEIPEQQYFVLAPRATAKTKAPIVASQSDNHPEASILEPEDRAEVHQRVTVRGRIETLNLDSRVWLVVGTPCGDNYPQCRVSRNNPEWEHDVRIGRVQWGTDEGAEYEIKLVAAETDGDLAFHAYMKSGRDGIRAAIAERCSRARCQEGDQARHSRKAVMPRIAGDTLPQRCILSRLSRASLMFLSRRSSIAL